MPDVYECGITETNKLTDTAYSITVACNALAEEAFAGQFIHIKCGDQRLLRRPFGICGVRHDSLRFVFELKGEGTRWLSERKPGDTLDILGPLGNGFNIPDGNIIVVGGGLGAPPMLYAAQSARGAVTAVLGFRDASRVMLTDDFEKVCETVVVTTDDGSAGFCGTVEMPIEKLLNNDRYNAVLVCGQLAMQRAVALLCRRYDIPCQVSLEERMGCGVGACLVCVCRIRKAGTVQMNRVCKDGPVFDSREVVW